MENKQPTNNSHKHQTPSIHEPTDVGSANFKSIIEKNEDFRIAQKFVFGVWVGRMVRNNVGAWNKIEKSKVWLH